MKTLLFCTSYFASQSAWQQRYQRWLDFHTATRLHADAIVLIDDGSPYLPPGIATIAAGDIGRKPLPSQAIVHFASNLGRSGMLEYPGWIRSFVFSVYIAESYGFDKIVHVESDTFLLTDRIVEYINRQSSGWTAFWVPYYKFAETAIQVLHRDNYFRLAQFRSHGPYTFRDLLMEQVLPFTKVEKKFLGDRYPEMDVQIPAGADYVVNTDVDTVLDHCPSPPKPPGFIKRLFSRGAEKAVLFEPLPRKTVESAALKRVDALLAIPDIAAAQIEIAALEQALGEHSEILVRKGIAHYLAGEIAEARGALESAVSLDPDRADGQKFLAATRMQQGETSGAISAAIDAVRLKDGDAGLQNMAGAFLLQAGRHADAIGYFERASALDPGDASPLVNLASVRWDSEEVRARYPNGSEPVDQRSRARLLELARQGRLRRPGLLELLRLGVRDADDFRVLMPAAGSLELSDADGAQYSFALGNFFNLAGDATQAQHAYLEARRMAPENARYRNAAAYQTLFISSQAFTESFEILSTTWPTLNPPAYSDDTKTWNGRDLAEGESLFVYQEQGVGDALMALRLLAPLEERGIAIVLWTQPGIADLARASFKGRFIDQETRPGRAVHGCSEAIPLLGLIAALGLDHAAVRALYRPLLPSAARVTRQSSRLGAPLGALRVGLALLGNPDRKDDALRSIPAAQWPVLSALAGIAWVNLSVDVRSELDQLKRDFKVVASSENGSFDDTAALIASLDVVVAIDSVVAHLAAVQGKPVLLLAPTICDWRWQIDADLKPWWPSVEVLRANAPQAFQAALVGAAERLLAMRA